MELVGKHGFTSLASLKGQSIGSIACLLGRDLVPTERNMLTEALRLEETSTAPDNFMCIGRGFRSDFSEL
jgi:hypothetical protein